MNEIVGNIIAGMSFLIALWLGFIAFALVDILKVLKQNKNGN